MTIPNALPSSYSDVCKEVSRVYNSFGNTWMRQNDMPTGCPIRAGKYFLVDQRFVVDPKIVRGAGLSFINDLLNVSMVVE